MHSGYQLTSSTSNNLARSPNQMTRRGLFGLLAAAALTSCQSLGGPEEEQEQRIRELEAVVAQLEADNDKLRQMLKFEYLPDKIQPLDFNSAPSKSFEPISPDLLSLHRAGLGHQEQIIRLAEQFMPLVPSSSARNQLEYELMTYLESQDASAADILLSLEGLADIHARAWAMELLWQKRQQGTLTQYNINPLDEERITWCINSGIDPRVLAISREVHEPTIELLTAAPDLFYEAAAQQPDANQIRNALPNPGLLARLVMSETGWIIKSSLNSTIDDINKSWGYVNIGNGIAWDEVNRDRNYFPSAHDDLNWIASKLQAQKGLPFMQNVQKIPGSRRGDPKLNGSGGAIGAQFMPISARLFMGFYDDANQRLGNKFPPASPFNPFTGLILVGLYLASEFYHRQENVDHVTQTRRQRYIAGNEEAMLAACMKWNPYPPQAREMIRTGINYYYWFGRV